MSKYKEWTRGTSVETIDVERWDDKVSPEEFQSDVMGWLMGGGVMGLNRSYTLFDLFRSGMLISEDTQIVLGSGGTKFPFRFNVRSMPIGYTSSKESFFSEDQLALLSTNSTKSIVDYTYLYESRGEKYGSSTTLQTVIDMKKFLLDNYGEIFRERNPSWNTITNGLDHYRINLKLLLGGPYTRDMDNHNNTTITDTLSGVKIKAAGPNGYVDLPMSTKGDPVKELAVDGKYLRKICTYDGLLFLVYEPKLNDVNSSTIAKGGDYPAKAQLMFTGKVGVEGDADYSFYKTFVTRDEFNKFLVGEDIELDTQINSGRELMMDQSGTKVIFGKSPIKLLASGTRLDLEGSPLNLDKFNSIYSNNSEVDRLLLTGRNTEFLRRPFTGGGEGSLPTHVAIPTNEVEKKTVSLYDNALKNDPVMNSYYFMGMPSNYLAYQGWSFDWVLFFDNYFQGIFPQGYSKDAKISLIKSSIKPEMEITIKDVRFRNVLQSKVRKEDTFRPAAFKTAFFINQGDNLKRLGSIVEDPIPSRIYEEGTSYQGDWTNPSLKTLENVKVDYRNIDTKGMTYVGAANLNFFDNYWRMKYKMQAENSPIVCKVTFQWGLRKVVATITDGVTKWDITNLQEQIDKLKK